MTPDCIICHHSGGICDRCDSNCFECKLGKVIDDKADKTHKEYWKVAKRTNPPQLDDEDELPYDDLCDCPSCTGRGGMGFGTGGFGD